jgi:hypothetical protein
MTAPPVPTSVTGELTCFPDRRRVNPFQTMLFGISAAWAAPRGPRAAPLLEFTQP